MNHDLDDIFFFKFKFSHIDRVKTHKGLRSQQ